jgi:hypothetical protein
MTGRIRLLWAALFAALATTVAIASLAILAGISAIAID